MSLDFVRLGRLVAAAREARGWRQEDLAQAAGMSRSAIQNLERGRPFRRMPPTLKRVEQELGWEAGAARIILEGGDPSPRKVTSAVEERHTLIDPDSPDPVIRELSSGPVANDAMREELIRLYLEDLAEMEERARERARLRARRLAAAAAQPDEYDPLHDGKDPDGPGHSRATA